MWIERDLYKLLFLNMLKTVNIRKNKFMPIPNTDANNTNRESQVF